MHVHKFTVNNTTNVKKARWGTLHENCEKWIGLLFVSHAWMWSYLTVITASYSLGLL